MEIFIIYCVLINLIALYFMKIDKEKARQNEWRISERTLFFIALLGGAFGMFLGMRKFRHKTKHFTFKYGLPLLMILQLVILGMVVVRLS